MRAEKILVANRGEIAVRVIKTLKRLGLKAIAVYSEVDKELPHVQLSDEAYCIGPPKVKDSYLNIERIIEVAKKSNAVAIHPGYGLLSENPEFAKACKDNGLIFIGPDPETLELSGDKLKAREVAKRSGVEPVPGFFEPVEDSSLLLEKVKAGLGFPVIVKGVEGGGGIGMSIINKEEDFEKIIKRAKRRVKASFGSDKVYVERYLPRVKHVEVQILGDRFGNIATLGVRECSVQRRYQKLIEESPSPGALNKGVYEKLQESAWRIAKTINYKNAGTVEFLLTEDGRYYFLEINARLQVEHPVTEQITGIDLVEKQLFVAFGEKLDQETLNPDFNGHAIEARIYAEDPERDFIPTPGTIERFIYKEMEGIRVDHGIKEGIEITPYYDPLLAKVISFGKERREAIDKLSNFLERLVLSPIVTNIGLLKEIIDYKPFLEGDYYTKILEDYFKERRRKGNVK